MISKERIIMDSDTTKLQRKNEKNGRYKTNIVGSTSRVLKKFIETTEKNKSAFEMYFLPQNTRLHTRNQDERSIYVTEYPPCERTIRVDMNFSSRWRVFFNYCKKVGMEDAIEFHKDRKDKYRYATHVFRIVVPYTIFVTVIDKKHQYFPTIPIMMFFRNSPLRRPESKLYKAPFYNIDGTQTVCNFQGLVDLQQPNHVLVENAVKNFWESSFNSDITSNILAYRYRINFSNYFMWEYLSATEPMSIFKTKWLKHKLNLLEVVVSQLHRSFNNFKSRPINFSDIRSSVLYSRYH